jgi:hypothetical protein
LALKPQVVFEGKASIRFKSGVPPTAGLVREHFKPKRDAPLYNKIDANPLFPDNEAIGHKMGF